MVRPPFTGRGFTFRGALSWACGRVVECLQVRLRPAVAARHDPWSRWTQLRCGSVSVEGQVPRSGRGQA
jgi:hypothetical protein